MLPLICSKMPYYYNHANSCYYYAVLEALPGLCEMSELWLSSLTPNGYRKNQKKECFCIRNAMHENKGE